MIEFIRGKIIIITAPSGSGKTTIAKHLLNTFPQLSFSVSATTRPARSNEQEGVNYFFLNHDAFQNAIRQGKFFEYQEVYPNQFYGTLLSELDRIWSQQKVALFDIDVKGAMLVESRYHEKILSIYLKTSSLDVIRQRLIARGTDSKEQIEKRVLKAEHELEFSKHFDYVITNDKLDFTKKIISEIVKEFVGEQ